MREPERRRLIVLHLSLGVAREVVVCKTADAATSSLIGGENVLADVDEVLFRVLEQRIGGETRTHEGLCHIRGIYHTHRLRIVWERDVLCEVVCGWSGVRRDYACIVAGWARGEHDGQRDLVVHVAGCGRARNLRRRGSLSAGGSVGKLDKAVARLLVQFGEARGVVRVRLEVRMAGERKEKNRSLEKERHGERRRRGERRTRGELEFEEPEALGFQALRHDAARMWG